LGEDEEEDESDDEEEDEDDEGMDVSDNIIFSPINEIFVSN
jgi:hypothetical protein